MISVLSGFSVMYDESFRSDGFQMVPINDLKHKNDLHLCMIHHCYKEMHPLEKKAYHYIEAYFNDLKLDAENNAKAGSEEDPAFARDLTGDKEPGQDGDIIIVLKGFYCIKEFICLFRGKRG